MKIVSLLLGCAIFGSLVACKREPAYSNINVNRSRASGEQPAERTPPGPTPEAPAAEPNQPPPDAVAAQPETPAPANAQRIKPPAFLDTQKGEAKDLPGYPRAQTIQFEYGPARGGSEMVRLVQTTHESMDRIAEFYDKAIKKNGWEVTTRNRDPEYSEWKMKKGDRDQGGVTVKKDPSRGGAMVIRIARTAKPDSKKPEGKK